MVIDNDFKPSPSDFANYVYCSAKWALNTDPTESEVDENLLLGRQNEHKCIDWVCDKYRVTEKQILFDGTGKNNYNFLTSEIESVRINMHCQPDLIISKGKKNLLFEFKAVKKLEYLKLREFDSVHAQVWCYTNLKELRIDEYHLLRYFIDPCGILPFSFIYSPPYPYIHKKLTPYELDPGKFERLFERYIATIKFIKPNDNVTKEQIFIKFKDTKAKELVSTLFMAPNNRRVKCSNCINKKKQRCEI